MSFDCRTKGRMICVYIIKIYVCQASWVVSVVKVIRDALIFHIYA